MRFILQEEVYELLPPQWDDLVTRAKNYVDQEVAEARNTATADGKSNGEIEELVLKARHEAINNRNAVWGKAAPALRAASHGKCWYCESKQDRSDNAVDHFRPKNSVTEATGHPGYWWLAFDWTNLRYSCTYCNSRRRDIAGGTAGGKQDHFPIIPPPFARQM